MFARLGRWCHDHRWKVVILWVAVLFVGNGILQGAGGAQTDADFGGKDFESERGGQILEESFGGQGSSWGGSITYKADQGVDDPQVKSTMEELFADVADVKNVAQVGSPYAEGGEQQIANKDPNEGKIAFATVDFKPELSESDFNTAAADVREEYDKFVDKAADQGIQVELGGQALAEFEPPESELLGVAFAIFILILAFGSVLAMGLPIGVALAGIGVGTLLAGLLSFAFPAPSFTTTFGLMIGLGVGIDYALFIVTRYRENLHAGHDIRSSIAIAIDTAGRAVIFAGTTVVISILGMLAMDLSFINGMAIAIATVVLATMAASVTLLPAILGFSGHNIEVTRRRGLIAAAFAAVALIGAGLAFAPLVLAGAVGVVVVMLLGFFVGSLRKELAPRRQKPRDETLAYRWSRVIQHRPWVAALAGTAVLVVLAVPMLSLNLGVSDEGNFSEDTTTRKAYDMLADGFGPGYNGPLYLVSTLPDGADEATTNAITDGLRQNPGIDFITEPRPSEDGKAVSWQAYPTTSPQADETTDLVRELRSDVLPQLEGDSGMDVLVAGTVAGNIDFTEYLSSRLPVFLGAVLFLSFILLMAVFRSVLVPLKAVIMNLLSIGAAYGVMVAGFQWGWLGPVLDFDKVPIEPWMPMMMFAIVFGLSMDYEVFLLSRVREEWLRTGDSRTSVADGLAATARVITAAALIMVFVFGAFLLEDQTVVKLMGVGLATAVLLDATVVRMLLVPATMELLGDRNWWLPRWLDRILPRVDVEGGHEIPVDEVVLEDQDRQPVSSS